MSEITRREALSSIAAAVTSPVLPVAAKPKQDRLTEIIDRRRAWEFADDHLVRAVLAIYDVRDALSEYRHQHDLRDKDRDCCCCVCNDLRGWLFLFVGPMSIIESEITHQPRFQAREAALEAADRKREAEMDRLPR